MAFVQTKKENGQYFGKMYHADEFFESYKCCKECLVFAMCLEFANVDTLGSLWDARRIQVTVKKPCFKFEMTRAYYQPEHSLHKRGIRF